MAQLDRSAVEIRQGFLPLTQAPHRRLELGPRHLRWRFIGFDTGIELRTIGYFTDGGVHGRLQVLQAGPFALGFNLFVGGGGGPTHRNDFLFELGVPMTLMFGDLVRFMTSGPAVVMVLEGENAVTRYREVMGPTDSKKAPAGTIRGKYGTDIEKNAVHGSDAAETAKVEIGFFFTGADLV